MTESHTVLFLGANPKPNPVSRGDQMGAIR
jgi:hypothetical protein